ncbi:MAG: galactokinase [Acidimicrobiia bacterium]|nr:galactokinase [Acidimicrobiia bacterium]
MTLAAASGFRRLFGNDPTGVWAAPGRVNLIGEHTDYNEGVVLPFAIAERTEAAIASRQDGHIRMCSLQHPGEIVELKVRSLSPGLPRGWAAYVAGVAWAMECEEGFDLAIDGSVPLGSGLSSSAALTCSVGLGLNDLFGFGMTHRQIARAAQAAENDYVGAPTGGMDQIASLLCRSGHALLYDVRADTTEQVPFAPEAAGLSVLVVDSMIRHGHASGEYQSRRQDCEESARRLSVRSLRGVTVADLPIALEQLGDERLVKRTRHVVTENQRVLDIAAALARDDWERVGRLLTEAHESYRDDFAASCPEVDVAVEALLEAGALGARLTGGGFGGAAIALIGTDDIDDARSAVDAAYDERNYQPASMFTVMPSAGAQRIA